MRADRLVVAPLTLQARGRVTAAQLAPPRSNVNAPMPPPRGLAGWAEYVVEVVEPMSLRDELVRLGRVLIERNAARTGPT